MTGRSPSPVNPLPAERAPEARSRITNGKALPFRGDTKHGRRLRDIRDDLTRRTGVIIDPIVQLRIDVCALTTLRIEQLMDQISRDQPIDDQLICSLANQQAKCLRQLKITVPN